MGMAASQARFLSLTARKNNTEYEGQQVNQQRTTLSNQSANYYNQLMGMKVPTPPSSTDYTKTVYSFKDGSLTNSITSMIAQNNQAAQYVISYTSTYTDDFSVVSASSSVVVRSSADPTTASYTIGSNTLRELGVLPADPTKDAYLSQFTTQEQLDNVIAEENNYKTVLSDKDNTATWLVRYLYNSTTKNYSPYFYKKSNLDNATYSDEGLSQSNIPAFTIGSADKTEEIKGVTASFEQDQTGRLISITINPGQSTEATYSLTTNTTTDQAAYNDAMNQYEFNKYEYDQKIQDINAKIEIVQSEDKTLE